MENLWTQALMQSFAESMYKLLLMATNYDNYTSSRPLLKSDPREVLPQMKLAVM